MPRPARWVRIALPAAALAVALAAALASAVAAAPDGSVSSPVFQAFPSPRAAIDGTLPVVAEYRYRLIGKVRVLFFWISRDGVGAARIRVRRGEHGGTGYDLLIGSDPARAPRGINRWGYILEETRGDETTVVGLMKKSDEETLDQAESNIAREGQGGVTFKMIQAVVTPTESIARVTTATVPRDYSYRDLGLLVDALAAAPSTPKVQTIPVPPGGRPGLLTSLAELIGDATRTVQRTGKAPGRASLLYVYFAKQYEVSRVSASVETNEAYGGVTYRRSLREHFEVRARKESWTEKFTIVTDVDGPLAGVPVFVHYQPRWWFAVEMVLDEREKF